MKKYFLLTVIFSLFSILSMARPKNGLYKIVQSEVSNLSSPRFDDKESYLWINDGKAYRMGVRTTRSIGNEEMYIVQVSGTDINELEEIGTDAIAQNIHDGLFSTKTIKYRRNDALTSREMKHFMELMKQSRKSNKKGQQLKGTWFESKSSKAPFYKYYGEHERVVVHQLAPSSLMFSVESVKYLNDGNTTEGKNLCIIQWKDKYKYDLHYSIYKIRFTQDWTRIPAPKLVTRIF